MANQAKGTGEHAQPIIHMIGNAHLDPAWMWTWNEGMEAFLATCRSALDRMNENSDFIFTCGSAAHYRWVEEVEPELFRQIQQRVAEGRWSIVGGWWLQADCNLPSGEGFVRQALLGQRYFLNRFGVCARTGYSPDAFGHNRGLPQLLARSGMDSYIFCRPDPDELPLPSPLFRWHSQDGSSVVGYRVPYHYNMYESSVPKKISDLTAALATPTALTVEPVPLAQFGTEWALFYGVGNHGGGPTREHIRQILEFAANPAAPDVRFSTLGAFFNNVLADEASDIRPLPVWDADLQLNAPGCYSAHTGIKQSNRASEHGLLQAERIATLDTQLNGTRYPADELREAWRNVCFNHFHDILCGVATREALLEALETYCAARATATRITRHALQRIARTLDTTGPGQPLIVYNPHMFDVEEHVTFELWHDIDKALWGAPVPMRVTDDAGNDLPCQTGFTSGKIGKDRVAVTFRAAVPALGWQCYRVYYGEESKAALTPHITTPETPVLENEILRVELDTHSGAIARLLHKPSGIDILAGEGALPIVIEDTTDTWGHGVKSFDNVLGSFGNADVLVVEHGPVYTTVRATSTWGSSRIVQDFLLYQGSSAIHVKARIFWGERHTMLKFRFVTALTDTEALCESAYAVTHSQPDGTERPCGAWAALTGNAGAAQAGLAVISDTWHGFSANSSELALSALRSPSYATHIPHPFNPNEDMEYLDQGTHTVRYSIVPIIGNVSTAQLARQSAVLNAPLLPHLESAHAGNGVAERSYSGIEISAANVHATVLKQHEDGEGWTIRLYEAEGIATNVAIRLVFADTEWQFAIGAWEVRTFVVADGIAKETDLTELELT